MTIARRFGLGFLLAASMLVLPSLAGARLAPRRCPRARPADGDACPRVAMVCPYRVRREGSSDMLCTCVLGPDDARTWQCVASGPVYSD